MPDNDAAVARFRELLQLPTVSHADETEIVTVLGGAGSAVTRVWTRSAPESDDGGEGHG